MRVRVLAAVCVVLLGITGVPLSFAAVNGDQVRVETTTVPGVPAETVSSFDLTQADALVLRAASTGGTRIAMPYAKMTDFEYSEHVARHLGVLPAVGASLVRKRERKHFFTFSWTDDAGTAQVLTVEVAKTAPMSLLAILRARAPQVCATGRQVRQRCGVALGQPE